MGLIKQLLLSFVIVIAMVSFSQCTSAQKLQDEAPFNIGEVYFQKWAAGVKGGGSGLNLFIPVTLNENNIVLDSVYFGRNVSKLERAHQDGTLYIGRFESMFNKKPDIIMSNEPNAEYGNPLPIVPKKIPFKISDRECVVSYKENNATKYFKISNITEKPMVAYPSVPLNKQ